MIGLVLLVALIALSDGFLYLSGRELVTPFQLQSYTTAAAEGWLPAMWVAAVLVAPAGEEIIFRGFLFRGIGDVAGTDGLARPSSAFRCAVCSPCTCSTT